MPPVEMATSTRIESPIQDSDPEAKIGQHVAYVVENGYHRDGWKDWFLSATPNQLFSRLAKKVELNKGIEQLYYAGISAVSSWRSATDPLSREENADQASADLLYDLLAGRDGCSHDHRALFQLSDFNGAEEDKDDVVYNLFLSCCPSPDKPMKGVATESKLEWHRTVFTFERFALDLHQFPSPNLRDMS